MTVSVGAIHAPLPSWLVVWVVCALPSSGVLLTALWDPLASGG